jgi:hypothetical protein
MKYLQPRFTLPASQNTNQVTWDLAFLSKEEFVKKYGEAKWKKLSGVCG